LIDQLGPDAATVEITSALSIREAEIEDLAAD
jgi:hypothetical protein